MKKVTPIHVTSWSRSALCQAAVSSKAHAARGSSDHVSSLCRRVPSNQSGPELGEWCCRGWWNSSIVGRLLS